MTSTAPQPEDPGRDWWRGGVIYQIYPRSFADSNGDGVGDLPGITAHLDHIAALGVDAIWLSPFFKSPMKDFGYDISDYREVDPLFGTLADFDALVARAHALGLKVMIDQVLSHSSDQHAWFRASRSSRDNPKADWYVWADPKPDGTAPNNWLSIFGGSAWQWDSTRRQYYLHNFLASQPDLNLHCPEVQAQVLSDVEFWLKRGVDGLRLDVVNFYFHDRQLRDNPPWGDVPRTDGAVSPQNPYAWQRHLHDKSQPENLVFLQALRRLLDRYGATTSVGEIGDDQPFERIAEYTSGHRLHMAYLFNLLTPEFSAALVRSTVTQLEGRIGEGWTCWSVGNHDVPRVLSRWGGAGEDHDAPTGMDRAVMAMLLSLRGSACIYQGEELGLPEADLPFEAIVDPFGIEFWPAFKGRDGCRTPMPWRSDAPAAGFSTARPWLPVPESHCRRAADLQDADSGSLLEAYRRFLGWRRQHPALRTGSIRFLDAPADVLAFVRECAEERLVVAINLGPHAATLALPPELMGTPLSGHGMHSLIQAGAVELPPWGAYYGALGR